MGTLVLFACALCFHSTRLYSDTGIYYVIFTLDVVFRIATELFIASSFLVDDGISWLKFLANGFELFIHRPATFIWISDS